MIGLIAIAGFAVAVATSAQAMTPAPVAQPDGAIIQVREGCGPGMVIVNGACVARSAIRQTRRDYHGNGGSFGTGDYHGNSGYYRNGGYYGTSGTGGYNGNGCYQTRNSYGRIVTVCP